MHLYLSLIHQDRVLVQFSAWVVKEVTRSPAVIDAHAEELWAAQVCHHNPSTNQQINTQLINQTTNH